MIFGGFDYVFDGLGLGVVASPGGDAAAEAGAESAGD